MEWLFNKLRMNSLQKRIAVTFTLLIFAQILLYAVISYRLDTQSINEQVSEANLITVDEMKNRLETEMKILERVSYQLSKTSQIQQHLREINGYVRNETLPGIEQQHEINTIFNFTNESWPEISNMYVYNLQGNAFGKTKTEVATPIQRVEDFTKVASTKIDYGIPLNKTYSTKDAVISYFRLIVDENTGESLGLVRLDLILNEMGLMQDLMKDSRRFLVYEPYGKLILTNQSDNLDIVTMAKILNIKNTRGSIFYNDNLISYTKSDYTGWRIVSIVPEQVLNEGLIGNKLISIGLVAVSFILSVIASSYFSYRIALPIRNLFISMKRVEEGNLKTRVEVVSNDEIGQLGRQMNTMMDSIDQLINKVYIAEIRYKDSQFQMLSMQINPHFLYNTLEVIDVSSLKGNRKEVSQMIYSLTSMLRHVLKSNRFVNLENEIQFIESYLSIQSFRYPNNFIYKLNIDRDKWSYEVPMFILQPVIENAFKHGLFQKDRNYISIYAEQSEEYLKIHLVDNGIGMKREALSELQKKLAPSVDSVGMDTGDNHIGLLNVHYRIRHAYGDQFGLLLESCEGYWFKVTIVLPNRRG